MSLDQLLAWISPGSPDETLARQVKFEQLPAHIAIIMDGNGRWAAQRHLPRVEGHRAGIDSVRDVVETSARLGIDVLTLYAFSVENWKRPPTEVSTLMTLLKRYLRLELSTLLKNNIRFRVIGREEELSNDVRQELELLPHVVRQLLFAADHAEADVVLEQRAQLEPQVALEQRHQRADLGRRPLPVLDREGVERQDLDAEPRRGFDHVAHRVDAGAVPFDARQVTLSRPASVAVHDDRDVSREPLEVDLPRQRFVGRSWRNPRQELIKRHPGSSRARADNTGCSGSLARRAVVDADEKQAGWRHRRAGRAAIARRDHL